MGDKFSMCVAMVVSFQLFIKCPRWIFPGGSECNEIASEQDLKRLGQSSRLLQRNIRSKQFALVALEGGHETLKEAKDAKENDARLRKRSSNPNC